MWSYEKRLQFPVNIKEPNAKLAQVILTQYGGPDGELGASMRYISQRYSMPYSEVAAVLTDIGVSVSVLHILDLVDAPETETSGALRIFNNFHAKNVCGIVLILTIGVNGQLHAEGNAFQPDLNRVVMVNNHFIQYLTV